MKKCNRCGRMLDWEKSYCPLCGGNAVNATATAQVSAAGAASPPQAEENEADFAPPLEGAEPLESVTATIEHSASMQSPEPPSVRQVPAAPADASKMPGLDYLVNRQKSEGDAPQAPERPQEGTGIVKGSAGGRVELSSAAQERPSLEISEQGEMAGASFGRFDSSKKDNGDAAAQPEGEFLKMFPDAKA